MFCLLSVRLSTFHRCSTRGQRFESGAARVWTDFALCPLLFLHDAAGHGLLPDHQQVISRLDDAYDWLFPFASDLRFNRRNAYHRRARGRGAIRKDHVRSNTCIHLFVRKNNSTGCLWRWRQRLASCFIRCCRRISRPSLRKNAEKLRLPCLSILGPVLHLFQSYLGAESTHKVGAQHTLNAEYFRRIDALNYTMMHDDGQQAVDLEEADVLLIGVSRTSKTPTSIYLANRGVKTANIPLVPGAPLPPGNRRA